MLVQTAVSLWYQLQSTHLEDQRSDAGADCGVAVAPAAEHTSGG